MAHKHLTVNQERDRALLRSSARPCTQDDLIRHELRLEAILIALEALIVEVLMTNAELSAGLSDLKNQVTKIGTESEATLKKVQDLENAINGAQGVPQDVIDAFTALKTQVQTVDDLIPDTTPTTP